MLAAAVFGLLAGLAWSAAVRWRKLADAHRRDAFAMRVQRDDARAALACANQHRDALLVSLGRRQERAEELRDIALQAATLAQLDTLQRTLQEPNA